MLQALLSIRTLDFLVLLDELLNLKITPKIEKIKFVQVIFRLLKYYKTLD